jgi:hypothetical protein
MPSGRTDPSSLVKLADLSFTRKNILFFIEKSCEFVLVSKNETFVRLFIPKEIHSVLQDCSKI